MGLGAPEDSWAGYMEGQRVASTVKLNVVTTVQLNPAACTGARCLSACRSAHHAFILGGSVTTPVKPGI